MPRFLFRLVTALTLLVGMAGAAGAQLGGASHMQATLAAESMAPRAGSAVTLAFVMRPEQGWHGYWQNPGDAGVATRVTWTLPRGVHAGAPRYPVPQTLVIGGLMNYVFEGEHALLVDLTIPAGLARGTALPVAARLDYLVCSESLCVPGRAMLQTRLTVGDGTVTPDGRAAFDRFRARLPRPLGSVATFAQSRGMVRLKVPLPRGVVLSKPYFFPLTKGLIDYAAAQTVARAGDALVVTLKAVPGAAAPPRLDGVLRLTEGEGVSLSARPGVVPAGGVPLANGGVGEDEGAGVGGFLLALGGALLGGLLLNLMPCVFPILSLKALGLARAGADPAAARIEAGAYAAGAVLACLALGGTILALRAGGEAAGWAFQLQDPRVTLLLLVLVTAIGLNLAGLFELPTLGGGMMAGGGVAGAFLTGALAAFVATPCTGPFMAAALGAALLLPTAEALAVFGGLGLGLALPFLLLAFVPRLQRLMPRPGGWMETLRHLLALPMLATALWLAWLLGRQAGVPGMTFGLGGAVLAGVVLWWIGLRQGRGRSFAWGPALLLLAAAPAAMLVTPAAAAPTALHDEPFSEARLAAYRAQHRPVFLYLTADWCLTCKVNEAAAIDRSEVRDAFARRNVAVMAGDWTRGDPAITRFLASQNRSGVPLYLFYPANGAAQLLPQVLTPGRLEALAG